MKSLCLLFAAVVLLCTALFADTIIPRTGTTAQITGSKGIHGEVATDMQTHNLAIYDGKNKAWYYTAGATVTVVNNYATYTTSNTINNTYNYGIINSTDTYYFAPDLRTYLHFDGTYVTMIVNGVEYERWGAEVASGYIFYAGNQVIFNGNKLRY